MTFAMRDSEQKNDGKILFKIFSENRCKSTIT